jgi:hypothetical protein
VFPLDKQILQIYEWVSVRLGKRWGITNQQLARLCSNLMVVLTICSFLEYSILGNYKFVWWYVSVVFAILVNFLPYLEVIIHYIPQSERWPNNNLIVTLIWRKLTVFTNIIIIPLLMIDHSVGDILSIFKWQFAIAMFYFVCLPPAPPRKVKESKGKLATATGLAN